MKALLFTPIILCIALAASGISAAEVFITAGGRDAWAALEELQQAGIHVAFIGEHQNVWVPAELRFKPVAAHDFLDALARANDRKILWVRENTSAVLYSGTTPAELERFSKDLESKESSVRRNAAWRAGWLREVAVIPALLTALQDNDDEVARQARVSLRRLGWNAALLFDARAFEYLCNDLKESDPVLRATAATASRLVQVRDVPRALAELEKLLDDPSKNVRQCAVESLAHFSGGLATKALDKAFSDIDDDIREAAIFALAFRDKAHALSLLDEWPTVGQKALRERIETAANVTDAKANAERIERQFRSTAVEERSEATMNLPALGRERALILLKEASGDSNADVRTSAVQALGVLGGDDALNVLEQLFVDADRTVRDKALASLPNFSGERALALLERKLNELDEHAKEELVGALGSQGSKGLNLLSQVLNTGSVPVRVAAVFALASIDATDSSAWIERAASDANSSVRRAAYHALGISGGDRAVTLLSKAVEDPEASASREALIVLGELGGEKVLQTLEELYSHANKPNRANAIEALGAPHPGHETVVNEFYKSPAALAFIEKAVSDRDAAVRRGAMFALGTSGLDRALEILGKALADRDAKIRSVAATALGKIGGAKVVPLLSAAFNDADKSVRANIVLALGQAGGHQSIDVIKKAFQDTDPAVRRCAALALNETRNASNCAFILTAAVAEKDKTLRHDLEEILNNNYLDVDGVQDTLSKLAPLR